MDPKQQFEEDVTRWIGDACAIEQDFASIVRTLPGVDPLLVASVVRTIDRDKRVRWPRLGTASPRRDALLPVPHPLDFDWRFSASTVRWLSERVGDRATHVTLIGAPTLWLALRERPIKTQLCLIDANPLLAPLARLDRAHVLIADVLRDDLPRISSDIVVLDPPWYPETISSFLWAAVTCTCRGGRVLVSVPPLGTRPGMHSERTSLLSWATTIGLTHCETVTGALRYETPPFERAALASSGLADFVPNDWRQGDLMVFERTGDCAESRPLVSRRRWTERVLGGVRIQVSTESQATADNPALVQLFEDNIMPTVSRRDPRRSAVRVWTSGNRVFGCASPVRLVKVIDELAAPGTSWSECDHQAAAAIRTLVEREQAEYLSQPDDGLVVG